ncbi:MAG: FkbM family methyltransferase [Verrucomicrobia bacterium]|nr:FkbM family methyltransferase [Verrucomicrobiota bacterium]
MITDRIYRLSHAFPILNPFFRRLVFTLPHRQRLVEHFGQRLLVDPSEMHGFYLYYEHAYDDYIFDFIAARTSRFSRALDVGANIGIYTVFLAAHFQRVDAFEPDPSNLERLKKNLDLNQCANVAVHAVCVGDRIGSVGFKRPVAHNQGIGSIAVAGGDYQVSSTTLDEFFAGQPIQPTLIKMDIEGAEWLASKGMRRVLAEYGMNIAILLETHPERLPDYGGSIVQLKDCFESYGMQVEALTPQGLRPVARPEAERFWWIHQS